MWKKIQVAAVAGVVWSNMVWRWTDNGYAALAIGLLLAYAVTAAGEVWWHVRRGLPWPRLPNPEPYSRRPVQGC
jgi:hypothetical protein